MSIVKILFGFDALTQMLIFPIPNSNDIEFESRVQKSSDVEVISFFDLDVGRNNSETN